MAPRFSLKRSRGFRRDWPPRRPRIAAILLALALLLALRWWQGPGPAQLEPHPAGPGLTPPAEPGGAAAPERPRPDEPAHPATAEDLAPGIYRVRRVVDGDTLLLENRARVRLLGVDTPETVRPDSPVEPWGPEASQFTKEFVGTGSVRLEFDRERLDEHGRFLAYVWVGDKLLNEALLRAGLGRALLRFPYSERWKRVFRKAEGEARSARRGIWSTAPRPNP